MFRFLPEEILYSLVLPEFPCLLPSDQENGRARFKLIYRAAL